MLLSIYSLGSTDRKSVLGGLGRRVIGPSMFPSGE